MLWIWLGSHAEIHQPAHDAALNPVTVLATFDVGQFLANVGIVATHANKTSSKILPTCWLILLDMKKKTAKLCRNLCGNGVFWYEKVMKMVCCMH